MEQFFLLLCLVEMSEIRLFWYFKYKEKLPDLSYHYSKN